jgi:AraC-like DNA-binding protein
MLPSRTSLYVSPILWKGDPVGHVGQKDVFFFVLEGECYLNVDTETHILRGGQLAFLPKGKSRRYTQISGRFAMYEISFDVRVGEESLMSLLGLTGESFVVDPPEAEELKRLFESSVRIEMTKDPIHSISAYANTLGIIKIYAEARASQRVDERARFSSVISYMNDRMSEEVTLGELADAACMHPTYFVKKFGQAFGMPPMAYLNRLRIYKAMGLLCDTDRSIEEIAELVGIGDRSYFARLFRKHTGAAPTEYRAAFL